MEMARPWKLLRLVLRIIVCTVVSWLMLVVIWIALPFPSHEAAGDSNGYATSILLAEKTLTRVYFPSDKFSLKLDNSRRGFALEYSLNTADLTLFISGLDKSLPIAFPANVDRNTNPYEYTNVTIRAGDEDGANLPWFPKADAILLFWWIHRETFTVPMVATWSTNGDVDKLILKAMRSAANELLEISMKDKDVGSVKVKVPTKSEDNNSYQPSSSSPSKTYPVRILLISIIAPSAIYINDHFGGIISSICKFFVLFTGPIFAFLLCGFILGAVMVSVWRCCGIRSRRVDAWVGRAEENTWISRVLRVCREGWHPERERATREEEETVRGLERGDAGGAKRVLERIIWEAKGEESTGGGRAGKGS